MYFVVVTASAAVTKISTVLVLGLAVKVNVPEAEPEVTELYDPPLIRT